jgi:ATP-dependent Lon protease
MSGTQLLPQERITLPLLPLRDVVVFPHMVIPLFVGRGSESAAKLDGLAECASRKLVRRLS